MAVERFSTTGLVLVRVRRSIAFAVSIVLASTPSFSFAVGQYNQSCQQSSQRAQQQCLGATGGANAGDSAQASQLGKTVGSSKSINLGSVGMQGDASGQIGRLLGADSSCEQAKSNCDNQCDSAQQQAQGDQKARQQGEPGQVSQTKQSQCDKPLNSMIGPLLQALAAALGALQGAKKTDNASTNGTPGNPMLASTFPATSYPNGEATSNESSSSGSGSGTSPTGGASMASVKDDGKMAEVFNDPENRKQIAGMVAAGGQVGPDGITMPNGSKAGWGSFGSSGGSNPGGFDMKTAMAQAAVDPAADARAPASVSGMGDGGSGGGGGGGSGSGANDEFKLPEWKDPFKNSKDKKEALVAGKTVMHRGEPVGVKGDDIFQMIHRAYVRKGNGNEFIVGGMKP